MATLPVSSSGGIAFGAGAVWVGNNGPHTVTRIDSQTNTIVGTIPLGDPLIDPLHGPTLLAFDHGSLWVLNGAADCSCVQRVDPTTNRIVATIPLGSPTQFRVAPLGIATTPDAIWVANRWGTEDAPAGLVVRIDPTTNRVPSMKSVVRINAETNSVAVVIPGFTCVEGQLAPDESGVWVADCDAVRYVNGRTNAIEKSIAIAPNTRGPVAGLAVVGVGVEYGSVDRAARTEGLTSGSPATSLLV